MQLLSNNKQHRSAVVRVSCTLSSKQLKMQFSVSRVLQRLLLGIGEAAPETIVNVLLESDSASALQLIHGVDIPKKSRHIEIRLLWIRSQIERGVVRMKHRAGSENVSDLFTKVSQFAVVFQAP